MKIRNSLFILAALFLCASEMNAEEDSSEPVTTTKKKTVIKQANPFEAQQKRIADAQEAVKSAKKRSKKSAQELLAKEQDQLKRMLKKETASLTKQEDELKSKLALYENKKSSKTESIQKELEKVQAQIKGIEEQAAIDKWCGNAKDDLKKDESKKDLPEKKHKKSS